MPKKGRLRALPLAVMAVVALLAAVALAELAFSHRPELAAEIIEAAVAVCGLVFSATVFLLPRLRERAQAGDVAQVTALPVMVPTGLLPSSVRGRDDEFNQLRRMLRKPSRKFAVLAGMGGVGKSTIAAEFARRIQRKWTSRWRRIDVWFVPATDPSSLTSALATVAQELGAARADIEAIGTSTTDAPDRLWRLLQNSRHKWLLILDNADDPAVLARPVPVTITLGASAAYTSTPADGTGYVRPSKRGLVLVTSRKGDPSCWGRHARILLLHPLKDADAAQVLLDRAPHAGTAPQAQALAQRLGGLPLALRTAGSYLSSDCPSVTSFHDYEIELMLTRSPELKAAGSEREVPIRTFEISLNDLSRKGVPQARPLLRLLSCYASPTPIPRDLLWAEAMRDILLSGNRTNAQHELERGLQELKDLSLIGFEQADGETVTGQRGVVVHRMVAVDGVFAPATERRRGLERASTETEWLPLGLVGLASSF
jgi:AAA ATPase domain